MIRSRKVAVILLTSVLIAAAVLLLILPKFTGFTLKETEENPVKFATFAICETRENYTYCKDKLYASCNGEPFEVNDSAFQCNGKTYETNNDSLGLGEAYLSENWSDPRPKGFITGWAVS